MSKRDNKEEYNQYMKEYVLKRYHRRREEAIKQLGGQCKLCGNVEGLEIDHINPEEKEYNIAKILSGGSEEIVKKELSKCQLLCRACHEEKTIKDLGHERAKCGTLSGYRYCKCELCKKANSDYCKEYRKTHVRKRNRIKENNISE